jgi:hypothetical protein
VFTRQTIVATPLAEPVTFWHDLILEDAEYKFVSRHYGSGGKYVPGFFALSKKRNAWIEITKLSTEHARLGRAPEGPQMLAVSWDYGGLIGTEYVSVPLRPAGFIDSPDRILNIPTEDAYRLDFNSRTDVDYSLTWLWVRKLDLEEAFEGRRRAAPATDAMRPEAGGRQTRIIADSIMLAPVRVNDGEVTAWLVDTASPATYLDRYYIRNVAGSSGLTLELDGVTLTNQRVTIAEKLAGKEYQTVGGVLGAPFFQQFVATIDYDRSRLTLTDSSEFNYGGAGQAVPLQLGNAGPVVRVGIVIDGRRVEARLRVETGWRHTIGLNQKFIDAQRLGKLRERTIVIDHPSAAAKHFFARASSVQLGKVEFKGLPISVFQDPSLDAGPEVDGVIGNGLLRRFRVTLDYRRQRMILEPGALIDVPYDYDLTGFRIVANGRALGVGSIEWGTAAQVAGLRAGDAILELDGKPVTQESDTRMETRLTALRRAFVQDGRDRVLRINRLGDVHTVTLKTVTLR